MLSALRFADSLMPDNEEDVVLLASKDLMQKFIRQVDIAPATNILQVGRSEEQVRTYLEKTIGPETWATMTVHSRNDLVQAEQAWGLSFFEFGAKREDWGHYVSLSARPIEAEIRDQLKEMLDGIEKELEDGIRERTLGGCLDAIRKARKKKDRLSHVLASSVYMIDSFLAKHRFIEELRNRSDHANRDEPVSALEFYKWRTMILKDGIFEVIINTARSFNAAHVR